MRGATKINKEVGKLSGCGPGRKNRGSGVRRLIIMLHLFIPKVNKKKEGVKKSKSHRRGVDRDWEKKGYRHLGLEVLVRVHKIGQQRDSGQHETVQSGEKSKAKVHDAGDHIKRLNGNLALTKKKAWQTGNEKGVTRGQPVPGGKRGRAGRPSSQSAYGKLTCWFLDGKVEFRLKSGKPK